MQLWSLIAESDERKAFSIEQALLSEPPCHLSYCDIVSESVDGRMREAGLDSHLDILTFKLSLSTPLLLLPRG
jgi:hypothetical protein